jgi:hypothetical protein
MSAPDFLVFDGGTDETGTVLPRRPSTDDLGGDEKVDDAVFPPDENEHPTAAGWNQLVKVVAALSRTAAACKLEVRYSAGAPYIARVTALSDDVALATFGTPTDNGTGDVSITWPANTFPTHALSPSGLTPLSSSSASIDGHVEEITNGIRVRMFSAGAAADVPFTVELN